MGQIIQNNNSIYLMLTGSVKDQFHWVNGLLVYGSKELQGFSVNDQQIIRSKVDRQARWLGAVLNKRRYFR